MCYFHGAIKKPISMSLTASVESSAVWRVIVPQSDVPHRIRKRCVIAHHAVAELKELHPDESICNNNSYV